MSAGGWIVWQTMSIIGIVLAAEVPAQWGLEFTAILALIAMTLPMISGKPALIGAVTAGVIAVVAAGLPLKLGLLVAVVAGIAAAMSTEIMLERHANTGGTIEQLEIWLVITGLTVVTILMRSSFLMLGDYFRCLKECSMGCAMHPCALWLRSSRPNCS